MYYLCHYLLEGVLHPSSHKSKVVTASSRGSTATSRRRCGPSSSWRRSDVKSWDESCQSGALRLGTLPGKPPREFGGLANKDLVLTHQDLVEPTNHMVLNNFWTKKTVGTMAIFQIELLCHWCWLIDRGSTLFMRRNGLKPTVLSRAAVVGALRLRQEAMSLMWFQRLPTNMGVSSTKMGISCQARGMRTLMRKMMIHHEKISN